jgi:hypothetical protein
MELVKGKREEIGDYSFEERLRQYPELRKRFEELLRVVENAGGDAVKANEAEDRVVEELHQMGQTAMQAWAERKHRRMVAESEKRKELTWNGKKNCTGTPDMGE